MATITTSRIPFYPPHFKGSPLAYTLRHKKGGVVSEGQGLSFYFRDINTSVSEVPVDDQELSFIFKGRSTDYQEVTVQGTVTYRIEHPRTAAARINFTVDLATGAWAEDPLSNLESMITQLCQQYSLDYLADTGVEDALSHGAVDLREIIAQRLGEDQALADTGLQVVSVRVASVRPSPEVEKALQTPRFMEIGKDEDQATYDRRASAVEQEAKISKNEQQNKIALAEQRAQLIAKDADNARTENENTLAIQQTQTEALAERRRIEAESQAAQIVTAAEAQATATAATEGARNAAEKVRMEIFANMDNTTLFALAAQALGNNLHSVGAVNITPDLLTKVIDGLANPTTNGHAPAEATQ